MESWQLPGYFLEVFLSRFWKWLVMAFFLRLRENDPGSPSCLCAQGKIRRVSGFLAWFLNHYIKIHLSPYSFLDKISEVVCRCLFPGAEDSYFNFYWELKCKHLKVRFEKPWSGGQFSIHFIFSPCLNLLQLPLKAPAAPKTSLSVRDLGHF